MLLPNLAHKCLDVRLGIYVPTCKKLKIAKMKTLKFKIVKLILLRDVWASSSPAVGVPPSVNERRAENIENGRVEDGHRS